METKETIAVRLNEAEINSSRLTGYKEFDLGFRARNQTETGWSFVACLLSLPFY